MRRGPERTAARRHAAGVQCSARAPTGGFPTGNGRSVPAREKPRSVSSFTSRYAVLGGSADFSAMSVRLRAPREVSKASRMAAPWTSRYVQVRPAAAGCDRLQDLRRRQPGPADMVQHDRRKHDGGIRFRVHRQQCAGQPESVEGVGVVVPNAKQPKRFAAASNLVMVLPCSGVGAVTTKTPTQRKPSQRLSGALSR
jgi:hypothetical protein